MEAVIRLVPPSQGPREEVPGPVSDFPEAKERDLLPRSLVWSSVES